MDALPDYPKAYNAFPNCPGLVEDLGLRESPQTPASLIKIGDDEYRWYSICSAHRFPTDGCNICRVGSYHKVGSK